MAKVLVADDEFSICQALSEFLEMEGHTCVVASSGKEALGLLDKEAPDMVFMDYQMPGLNGLQTLERIQSRFPDLPVVLMTAYGSMHTAIEAVRKGAFDYVGKPIDLKQVRALVTRALQASNTVASGIDAELVEADGELVGISPAMQEIFKLIGLLTTNDLNVLITGPSGVGKELVARAIHRHGKYGDSPFIAVNCAAIPENLIESELFGHEKGAYTGAEMKRIGKFEAAQDGVIFLDEISEMPLHLQSKLLRVLQEKTYERVGGNRSVSLRARIISASNRDLIQEVKQNNFREDLYHRLHLVNLRIPALCERREDIPILAQNFLLRAGRELGKAVSGIDRQALRRLEMYNWPGNVRELEHTIKRAVLTMQGGVLTDHDLGLDLQPDETPASVPSVSEQPLDRLLDDARAALRAAISEEKSPPQSVFYDLVSQVEKALIEEALRISGNNQVAASKLLGLNRTTLRNKLG